MRPQDLDALGRVAVEDTATGEVTHKHAHVAQEILERNPDGRFKILTKDHKDANLAHPKDADPVKRRRILQSEAAQRKLDEDGPSVADATTLLAESPAGPKSKPAADTAGLVGEEDGDAKKKARLAAKEEKARLAAEGGDADAED